MRRSLKLVLAPAACVALAAALAAGDAGVAVPTARDSSAAASASSAAPSTEAGARVSEERVSEGRARAQADGSGEGAPLKLPLVRPRLVVSKPARRLALYSDGRVVRTYRVGLGTAPVGDKERAGDRRTPEGDFYVCVKNPRSAFYLSLGLSYPNEEDAARGLRDRLITRAQHGRILRALRRGRTPPWDTALGGEIFIHGNGAQTDWTWGCVALEDKDVKELFDAVPVGTPVRIEP